MYIRQALDHLYKNVLRGQNSQEIINKDKSEFDGKNTITGNLLVKLTDGSVKKSLIKKKLIKDCKSWKHLMLIYSLQSFAKNIGKIA